MRSSPPFRRRAGAVAVLVALAWGTALTAGVPASGQPSVVRVYYDKVEDVRRLRGFDVWEFNNRKERYFLVAVELERISELEALGFAVEVDELRTAELYPDRDVVSSPNAIPVFPCYRTVEETFASALQLVAARPDLATWIDIGDTWQKTAGEGGYDMFVLRLTNSAIPGPKPKFIATSAIHAREYTTAELMTRFAERLVQGYGVDPDATWILDHHEVHLVLQTNPDGRKRAETGLSWRKNTNRNYCSPTSNSRGADLNRNFSFGWDCCDGSSSNQCEDDYHGPFAASEPEVQAVQAYLLSQFPDQRGPNPSDAAPSTATGLYLDVHSFSELVLWPWGFELGSPNATGLTTLGRKLAFFNDYTPQQAIWLYPTDGTTIDFVYGNTGVASYAFEIGTAFFQNCTTFETTVLPDNMDALFYAAKVARTPYLTPSSADTTAVTLSPQVVDPGEPIHLTAQFDGLRYNQSNGTQPTPSVNAGRYWIDVPPWSPGAVAVPLSPSDGAFGSKVEGGFGEIDTSDLSPGRHTVFVSAFNQSGVAGPITAAFLWVLDGNEGVIRGTITDARTGFPLVGTVSARELGIQVASNLDGTFAMALPDGRWDVHALASGYRELPALDVDFAHGSRVDRDFALQPSVLIVDGDDNTPNVRTYYVNSLNTLGIAHDIWDTASGSNEPDAALLDRHRAVLWFTGDVVSGPSSVAESRLASWLDSGRCLLVASQDYYAARGLTPFLQNRLGVSSVTSDANHTSVTGVGPVYGPVGASSLVVPYTNRTDAVTAGSPAAIAFTGTAGTAGVSRTQGRDRTTFLGFGVEALQHGADRVELIDAFLNWCFALPLDDGDLDGTMNGLDCAASDPSLWSRPEPARDLRVARNPAPNVSWTAPLDPGADDVEYDLLRSVGDSDFTTSGCVVRDVSGTTANDGGTPSPGQAYYYLVRVRNTCGETLGAASDGTPREAPDCP